MRVERPENYILSILPKAEWDQLRRHFEETYFAAGHVLVNEGEAFRQIYFPIDCVISSLAIFESGASVEMATIGREGAAPLAGLLGRSRPLEQQTVQIPGSALAIPYKAFRRLREENIAFAALVDAYVEAFVAQLLRSVACNAVHTLERRAARWLLSCQDRAGKDTFPLTQEFFAAVLGTGRPTINLVSGRLREAGIIHYRRGKLTVRNRDKLQDAACECYKITKHHYDEIFSRARAAITCPLPRNNLERQQRTAGDEKTWPAE